jgi:ribosomal protein S18 acetylase RimI-like enzyme
MQIRDAKQDELAEIGAIRVAAYRADGYLSPGSRYEPRLRGLGADGAGHVLVAVADDGALIGTVMLQTWPDAGELVRHEDEAEIRALAVLPAARGAGLGRALLSAVIDRATQENIRLLLLFTQPEMKVAHRLYESAGFTRRPEQDWAPEPGVQLMAYGLPLRPPA